MREMAYEKAREEAAYFLSCQKNVPLALADLIVTTITVK
jgi:hypothetical protein